MMNLKLFVLLHLLGNWRQTISHSPTIPPNFFSGMAKTGAIILKPRGTCVEWVGCLATIPTNPTFLNRNILASIKSDLNNLSVNWLFGYFMNQLSKQQDIQLDLMEQYAILEEKFMKASNGKARYTNRDRIACDKIMKQYNESTSFSDTLGEALRLTTVKVRNINVKGKSLVFDLVIS